MAVDITKRAVRVPRPPRRAPWPLRAYEAAIDLLFVPRCAACGEFCEPVHGAPLFCGACDEQLAVSERPTCPRCAQGCSEADLPRDDCGNCRGRRLQFAAARTIGPYQGELQQAVLRAKHAIHEPLALALGQRLAEAIERAPLPHRPHVVAAVPMHWLKRLMRKTNPALTMAQAVARQLELPLAAGLLVCRRYLQRQATLSPEERRRNVRGAFRASKRWRITGQRILLVDDVMTTGATAQEASRALREAGAESIYVATAARSSLEY